MARILQVSVSTFSLSCPQQVNNKIYLNVAAMSDSNIISKSNNRFQVKFPQTVSFENKPISPSGSCHWADTLPYCRASWYCNKFGLYFFVVVSWSIPSLPNFPFAQSLFPLGLLFFPILLFLKGLLWKASGLAKGPCAQAGSQEFSPETLPVCLLGLSINSPSLGCLGVLQKRREWHVSK